MPTRQSVEVTAGFLIDVVDYVLAHYSEAQEEVPIYGEDWLERRGQTLEEVRKEIPSLYNLTASRYKPRVAEAVPDEDPAELIREVFAIEREITAGLEKLLDEVK